MVPREFQFPYAINALTELPNEFQAAVQLVLPAEESIQSILMLPPQPFMKRGGIPRQVLLSTTHGILHVQDGVPLAANYLPTESLLYVHHRLILLYGGLELAGEVNGRLVRILAEYNTVGQQLIDAALRGFLQMQYGAGDPKSGTQEHNNNILNELGKESFKFMNGLRLYALQSGERLLGYIFQPPIRERFLRFFSRLIAPTSLFVVTNQAVIFVEEEKARGGSYGWLITMCPRDIVLTVDSKPMGKWQELSVLLLRNNINTERNLIVEAETALACKSLWASQVPLERNPQ